MLRTPPPRSRLWTAVLTSGAARNGAAADPAELPADGLRRSLTLLRAFRVEETDPGYFYRLLAGDSVAQVSRQTALDGCTVLDVGGGPAYFRDAFRAAGARYLSIDSDVGEMSLHDRVPDPATSVQASGLALPVRDASVDVCYSSNVLEHIAQPWQMADEMVRVTRPGGTIYLSYTVWMSPWGGHETAPWHYLGGERARRRYQLRHGRAPKNVYGTSLFGVSAAAGLRWARTHPDAVLRDARPRYHPSWARVVVAVPGLRELATWNLALVLRRRGTASGSSR